MARKSLGWALLLRESRVQADQRLWPLHAGDAGGLVLGSHRLMVRIRKDFRTLTASERAHFLQAVHDLNARGGYEFFVNMHDLAAKGYMQSGARFWPDQAHKSSAFLTWQALPLEPAQSDLRI